MEGRKIGNYGVKQSGGCDGEKKMEEECKGFMTGGGRKCLFLWSQTVQMAS